MSQLHSEVSYYTTFLYMMSKHTFFSSFLNFSRLSFRFVLHLFVHFQQLLIYLIFCYLFFMTVR